MPFLLSKPVLVFAVFLAFFLNLMGVPLFDLDEGAFSEATREMLRSGNFAATYLDGVPRYDKPILSYWFQSLSVSIFGLNEFALRLPSAIAASLWLYATYRFVRENWGEITARYTVLIMANMFWITFIGRAAIADAWLNLFLSLTLFELWRFWQTSNKKCVTRTYLWMALGLLTKGPVAVLIPLLASGLFFVKTKSLKRWLSGVFNPLGWLVLILVISPWLLMVYQDQGMDFFQHFIIDHNLNRFASTKEGHGGSLFYYVLIAPLIILPFSGGLFTLSTRLKTLFADSLSSLLLIWFLVVFVLVSFSKTQLPHYLLYGITPVAILFAHYRDTLFKGRWHCVFPILFFVLLGFLPNIAIYISQKPSSSLYEQALFAQAEHVFSWDYTLYVVLSLIFIVFITFKTTLSQINKLVLIGMIQTLFVFTVLIEKVADLQQVPVKNAAAVARQYPDKKVVAYSIKMPSFSVYRDAITPRTPPKVNDLIFTREDSVEELNNKYGRDNLVVKFRQGGIVLLDYIGTKNQHE